MTGARGKLLALAALVTIPAAAAARPALCVGGLAWHGLDDADAAAMREQLAQALASAGVEGEPTADTLWCDGSSVETIGSQGQIFIQVERRAVAARVQFKVVDGASAATIYLRTVGCPAHDFPAGVDFETPLESALLALHRPPDDQSDDQPAQVALRARGRSRARAVAASHGPERAEPGGPPPLAIAGWAVAGLSGALALSGLAIGAQALVLDGSLRTRANAGQCVRIARGTFVDCNRSLRSDIDFLTLLVWLSDGFWAAGGVAGGSAGILLVLGYTATERSEEASR
jgi:hypothetical protein